MSIAFLLTSLVVVATPGTGALITIAAGLTRGRRESLIAAGGCTLGTVPHLLAAITGLAALLHASGIAFAVVKWAGVLYLFWMAVATWREHGASRLETRSTGPRSTWQTITSAILANLLNPKLTLFFFAFLPQFVSADDPQQLLRMVGLSGVFMVMTFVVFALYGVCAAAMRDRVLTQPRVLTWMRRTFATTFVALGTRLALQRP